ncbi:hypothetical protein FA15DRAFT_743517 [Coprinopsis marcescibilis]|uniref:Uncharacterized protein n=1 Tax=Coprinopsis marcescibilis TaxID=230819 RepID=A0A5C3KUJ5_COPMA|nr:hypothetical protein FA15DRAFT_743517 [Coprinopsis marcescibilis]
MSSQAQRFAAVHAQIEARSTAITASQSSSAWGAGTIIAVAFSTAVFLILVLAFCFLVRRNRPFHLRHQSTEEKMVWSPVTSLDPTPLPSPTRSGFYEKRGPPTYEDADSSFSATGVNIREDEEGNVTTAPGSPSPSGGTVDELLVGSGSVDGNGNPSCISPLPLSPPLARLPSVKSMSSKRVGELVRPNTANITRSASAHGHGEEEAVTPGLLFLKPNNSTSALERFSRYEPKLSVSERRSGPFLPNEYPHLFGDRVSRTSTLRYSVHHTNAHATH